MDRKVFKEGTAYLSTVFESIKPEAISIYERHLNDLTDDEFREAIKKCIENRTYRDFPSIADLRHYAGKSLNSIADNAISKLKRLATKVCETNSVEFTDKTLNAVASRFAEWKVITDWSEEDWSYNYKRLIDLYKSFKLQNVQEDRVIGYDEERGLPYRLHRVFEIGVPMLTSGYIKPKELEYDDIGRLTEGVG